MKKTARPADIYLHFLRLAEAVRAVPSLPQLDPLEERMLSQIGRATDQAQRLSVRDMMGMQEYGAPATVHGRLKSMREKGWIVLSDTDDARRKQIELTAAALRHFDRLSGCLVQAAEAA